MNIQSKALRLFKQTKRTLTKHTGAVLASTSLAIGACVHQHVLDYNMGMSVGVVIVGLSMADTTYRMRRRRKHLNYLKHRHAPQKFEKEASQIKGYAATATYMAAAGVQIVAATMPQGLDTQIMALAGMVPPLFLNGYDAVQDLRGKKYFQKQVSRVRTPNTQTYQHA